MPFDPRACSAILCFVLATSVLLAQEDERPGQHVFVEQLGHAHEVNAIAASPDGRFALTGSADRTVRLWELKSGQLIRVLTGHKFIVRSVVFSSDSRFAVSGSEDRSLRFWDLETGRSRVLGENLEDPVTFVAISGKRVFASQLDHTLVYSLETGQSLSKIPLSIDAISADGQLLAGQPEPGVVEIRSTSGSVVRRITAHSKRIRDMHFSGNGSRLVTAGDEAGIRVWETASGRRIAQLTNHGNLSVAVLSPDGKRVFAVKGTINGVQTREQFGSHVLDVASGKVLCETKESGVAARFTVDGKNVILISNPRDVTSLRSADCVITRHMEGGFMKTEDLRVSPDASALFVGRTDRAFFLDLKTGRTLWKMQNEVDVRHVGFSSDGKRVWSATRQALQSSSVTDGKLIQTIPHPVSLGRVAAFSADGRFVVTQADTDQVAIRNTNGQLVRQLKIQDGGIHAMALSQDGSLFAVHTFGDSAAVWSVQNGQQVRILEPLRYVDGLLFSRDSKTLLAFSFDGDSSRIQFFNASNGRLNNVVPGPLHGVQGCALSRDGRFLLLAGREDTVQLHDAATGKLLGQTIRHSHPTTSVEFSADGRLAIVGHASDDMLRFYSLPSMKLVGTLRVTEAGTIFHTPDGRFDAENERMKSRVVFRKGGTNKLLSPEEIPRDLHVPGLFQKTIHRAR
jgi:WD40 repeat protein